MTDVPSAAKGSERQVAFSPNGGQFLVKTARSLCHWVIRDDGTLDLDGCRWSTGGWASDAAWAATDRSGGTVVVFDRTAEGAALREFFGDHEAEVPPSSAGDSRATHRSNRGPRPLPPSSSGRSASATASKTRRLRERRARDGVLDDGVRRRALGPPASRSSPSRPLGPSLSLTLASLAVSGVLAVSQPERASR